MKYSIDITKSRNRLSQYLKLFLLLFPVLLCGCKSSLHSSSSGTKLSGKWLVDLEYMGYEVCYDSKHKLPCFVEYELTSSEVDGPATRNGKNFTQDPSLRLPQAKSDDYRNSGWSRGHMAPAGDFKWDDRAMSETFYFTNCCPQNQSLNAGQWSTLEKKGRSWAASLGQIRIVTGPIIGENIYGVIGDNVVIPDAFFKAVLSESNGQGIAFIMYNKPKNDNLQKCAITIDSLEVVTGIDFFSNISDEIEELAESKKDLKFWKL